MMPDTTRPGPPYAAPRGHRWVPDVASDAHPLERGEPGRDRKCEARREPLSRRTSPCNATAVAWVRGDYRCVNHLGDRWLDAGVVMRWTLEPTGEIE